MPLTIGDLIKDPSRIRELHHEENLTKEEQERQRDALCEFGVGFEDVPKELWPIYLSEKDEDWPNHGTPGRCGGSRCT